MIEIVTAISLWELVKHTGIWVNNLRRAKDARKNESVYALREVILAARETKVYILQLKDAERGDHAAERRLSFLWTKLGFELEDIGVKKLAHHCNIEGKQWAVPSQYDDSYIKKATEGLERIEHIATEVIKGLDRQ